MTNQAEFLQHNITIEFLPYGSDMPYRIIVGNNPVHWVDPWGLWTIGPTCMVCEGNVHPLQKMASRSNVYSDEVNLTGKQWAAYVGVGLGVPVATALAIESAPYVVTTIFTNPAAVSIIQREGSDFITVFATPNSPPPTSAGGYAAALLSAGYKYWNNESAELKNCSGK